MEEREVAELLARLREARPLVHHITNWVTIYDCANAVRVVGALPVMAHAREEVQEMVGLAGALVLNIGTLTPELVESMIMAGRRANELAVPVVLDAVGAGATRLRTEKTREILRKVRVSTVKGNAAEIGVLAGVEAEVKGVEAGKVGGSPAEVAVALAEKEGVTVAVTGKTDFVAGKNALYAVENGHELMGRIVGTGCMAASVIGAFSAVEKDSVKAAAAALACFGIAGELAAQKAGGPGTFKELLFDELHGLDDAKILGMAKVKRI